MEQSNTKWFIWSRRFLGIALIAASFFIEIPEDVQQSLKENLPVAVEAIAATVGAIVTLIGYLRRDKDKKLTVLPRLPWRE